MINFLKYTETLYYKNLINCVARIHFTKNFNLIYWLLSIAIDNLISLISYTIQLKH